MNIEDIKKKLDGLVKYNLFQSSFLTEEKINDMKDIEEYLKKSKDIVSDIDEMYNSGTKEYLFCYSNNIKSILRGLELSYIQIVSILNSDIDYNVCLVIWNKLSNEEKINYLSEIRYINEKIVNLLNYTLENSKNRGFFNKLFNNKRIIDKFYDNSLIISSSFLDNSKVLIYDKYKKIKYIIVDYSVDNIKIINKQLWIIGKLRKVDVEKLNIDKSITYVSDDLLDSNTRNFIKEIKNEIIFDEEFIINSNNDSIIVFPFDDIDKDLLNKILNNYDYLLKFKMDIMVMIINTFLDEEDKIDLLRKEEFVDYLDSESLEDMLNSLSFRSVFNMLQNVKILNKVRELNIIIKEEDKIFITGYLDSPALVNKTNKAMLRDMLDMISDKVNLYIKLPYISSILNIKTILDIAIRNNIIIDKLYENNDIKLRIKRNGLIYYIDNYWSIKGINYDLIFNKYSFKILFNMDIFSNEDITEVSYLYDSLYIKGVKRIKSKVASFETFRAILCSYLLFGLKTTQEIAFDGNKNVNLDIIKKIKNYLLSDVKDYVLIDDDAYNKFIKCLEEYDYTLGDDINIICSSNDFIKEIINTIINTGCVSINELNNIIGDYLASLEYNFDNRDKELRMFIDSVNKYVVNKRVKIFTNNYDMIIKKHFVVKDDIIFKKKQSLGKSFIEKKQFELLVKSYLSSKDNKDLFIDEETYDSYKNILLSYFNKQDIENDIIIYKILSYLVINKGDIYSCLDNMGIEMPEYYLKYKQIIDEEELVKSINVKLKKIFKGMHITRINALLNNICYGNNYSFLITDEMKKIIKKYNKIIINLNGKVDVLESDGSLYYTSLLVFPNIDELNNYHSLVKKVKAIILDVGLYASKWISEDKVKEIYRKEYTDVINTDFVDYKINKRNYILDKREFYIDDFAYIFKDVKLGLNIKKIDLLKKLLIDKGLIIYACDGYLFSDSPIKDIINKWDYICDKIDFNSNMVDIYFDIKK